MNKVSLNDRTVFIGGIPRKGRAPDGLLVAMDDSIFNRWAHYSFPGQVSLAKLRVNLRNQSMGYGFLTFDAPESAEAAIKLGQIAFDSSFVEIKGTAQRSGAKQKSLGAERTSLKVTRTKDLRSLIVTTVKNVFALNRLYLPSSAKSQ